MRNYSEFDDIYFNKDVTYRHWQELKSHRCYNIELNQNRHRINNWAMSIPNSQPIGPTSQVNHPSSFFRSKLNPSKLLSSFNFTFLNICYFLHILNIC